MAKVWITFLIILFRSHVEGAPDSVHGDFNLVSLDEVRELLNLQDVDGMAKPYQIRQFLRIVERYNMSLGEQA